MGTGRAEGSPALCCCEWVGGVGYAGGALPQPAPSAHGSSAASQPGLVMPVLWTRHSPHALQVRHLCRPPDSSCSPARLAPGYGSPASPGGLPAGHHSPHVPCAWTSAAGGLVPAYSPEAGFPLAGLPARWVGQTGRPLCCPGGCSCSPQTQPWGGGAPPSLSVLGPSPWVPRHHTELYRML